MKKALPFALAAVAFAPFIQANDNLHVSGFGSIIGAQVVDGHGYVADYPNLGIYDNDFDLGKESKFGLQAVATINDKTSFTTQAMSRANNNYDPQVEWMFVNYAVMDDLELQAGKLRLPVYYFSEYMDVGYAYPWIRVPSDSYSLDLTNFNGAQLNYRTYMGPLNITLTAFGGRQENINDPLMSYLFPAQIDRDFTGIVGAGLEFSTDSTIVKLTYTEADMEQTRSGSGFADGVTNTAIEFYDVYLQQSFGDFTIMGEYNEYKPFYESWFVSGTYRMGDFTYYLLHSQFELDGPFEKHDTQSLGFRYDAGPRVALKFDVSQLTDEGYLPPGTLGPTQTSNVPNPVNQAPDGDGDLVIISTGIDFIF